MNKLKINRHDKNLKIPSRIIDMLNSADTEAGVFPPTILYNEGWMLRLVLSACSEGISCLPFSFLSGSRWFSEALLYSPFLKRFPKDRLAEACTHLDGAVGHFRFTPNTKTGLELLSDSKQFITIEAKMYSPLSRGTKNAAFYDQAARTVACMATTLERSHTSVKDFESIGFYIMAPEDQIRRGVFAKQITRENIITNVLRRIEMYQKDKKYYPKLQSWFQDRFDPLIKKIDLRCWSWETTLEKICAVKVEQGTLFKNFYKLCQKYN
ncbi:hypothetical protein ACFLQ6_09560 [Thermoproteota archaeon]